MYDVIPAFIEFKASLFINRIEKSNIVDIKNKKDYLKISTELFDKNHISRITSMSQNITPIYMNNYIS